MVRVRAGFVTDHDIRLSPDDGLQPSHTAQGLRSASGSADGTSSRWVMEKAGENARRAARMAGFPNVVGARARDADRENLH